MTEKEFMDSLKSYLVWMSRHTIDEKNYSTLWARFINNFKYEKLDDFEKSVSHSSRGYAFLPKTKSSIGRSWVNLFLGGIHFYLEQSIPWLAKKFDSSVRKIFALFNIRKDTLYRFYDPRIFSTRRYLKKKGIKLESYYQLLSKKNPISETYNTNKIFYYFDVLKKSSATANFDNVIEVGSGAANFPILLSNAQEHINYVIIDLPEMLAVAAHQIHRYVENAQIVFPDKLEKEIGLETTGRNFYLLTPSDVSKVPSGIFDLSVNMESFAEMYQTIADDYLAMFYRSLKRGGTMYLVNRESRVINIKGEVVNLTSFWRYPLSQTDEVDILKFCEFRKNISRNTPDNVIYLARKAH